MKTLCMDTTNKYLVVGLYEDGRLICGSAEESWKRQSETLFPTLIGHMQKAGWESEDLDEVVITDRDGELIRKVMKWLEENVSDSEVTVDNLASYVGMGRTSMYNKLKGLTGKSPVELIQEYRLEKATYYLKSGQYSVSETSYKVGFSDPGYFSRSFKKHFGISPADYIKEHKNSQQK